MVPAASDLQQAPEQTARSQVRRFVFVREQLADGVRSVPRVTSGSQKTGCANRGLHVWTTEGKSVMFLVALGKRARRRLVTLDTSRLRQQPNL